MFDRNTKYPISQKIGTINKKSTSSKYPLGDFEVKEQL